MYPSWSARAVGLSLTAAESIEIAARAGFQGVDLMVRDLVAAGEDPTRLRDRMDALGLRGGAWPLPVSWRNDAETFAEDLRRLPDHARTARALGLLRTGTWVLPAVGPGRFPGAAEQEILAQVSAMHLDRLGKIAVILADHDIRLGLEIMGPASARGGAEILFVDSYRRLAERLGELHDGHPNVGVLVDAFHLFASGEEAEAGMVWGVERVVWVHVADATTSDRATLLDQERELPGQISPGDCRLLLARLADEGYDGPVTAEPLGQCRSIQGLNPIETARRVKESLSGVWPAR